MAVSTPTDMIVARTAPAATPKVVPIAPRQRKRLNLFDAIVAVGCEVIALGATAIASLAATRGQDADAGADLAVARMRRQARLGAEESDVNGCACWRRFRAIDAHGAEYVAADGREDWLVVKAFAAVARICEIARGLNRKLSSELAKRGRRG